MAGREFRGGKGNRGQVEKGGQWSASSFAQPRCLRVSIFTYIAAHTWPKPAACADGRGIADLAVPKARAGSPSSIEARHIALVGDAIGARLMS